MQVTVLTALVVGCCTGWMDVDTQVARYNVDAYLSGQLETVDVGHLGSLSEGAVPQLARLLEASDPAGPEGNPDHPGRHHPAVLPCGTGKRERYSGTLGRSGPPLLDLDPILGPASVGVPGPRPVFGASTLNAKIGPISRTRDCVCLWAK